MNTTYSNSGIIGTGHALPADIISNADLENAAGLTDEWITTRTGIKERRRANKHESASTLGASAATLALQDANLNADEIDLIICTTISPDKPLPSTACLIQNILGANRAACFDLAAACSGFIYGLEIADKMIKSGAYQNALVVSVDLMTRTTDYNDPKTSPLFGDGAGAVVLTAVEKGRGILASRIFSDGGFHNLVHIPAGGSLLPASYETVGERLHFMQMDGNKLFKLAVKTMIESSETVLRMAQIKIEEIDLIIPHQANQRIIDAIVSRLEIPHEKTFGNIEFVGNTASASIPIALDQALKKQIITENKIVLVTAFGGGATWGAAIIKF